MTKDFLYLYANLFEGLFSFINAVSSPTVGHLEERGVSLSQSTYQILSRHPFSQMSHLLEPPQFAVMCKDTSLPPPPSPRYVPCVWTGTDIFETSFCGLHLIVDFQI